MTEPQAPKIEFPCPYPLKIVGHAAEDFTEFVIDVVERHAGTVVREHVDVKSSSGGKYLSVRVTITATGEDQLKALFTDLKQSGRVQVVL